MGTTEKLLQKYTLMIDDMNVYISTVLDFLDEQLIRKAINVYQEYETMIHDFYNLAAFLIQEAEAGKLKIDSKRWELIQSKTAQLYKEMKTLENRLHYQITVTQQVEHAIICAQEMAPPKFDGLG